MKTIVIGDIHARSIWKEILVSEKFYEEDCKVVFLGDYVSTHENYSPAIQIDNLMEIMEFKENYSDRVIMLRGNHDGQHLGYYWAECSGYFPDVARIMSEESFKKRFLRLTQWIYKDDIFLYSHAGVSNEWFNNCGFESLDDINRTEPCEKFGFIPDSPWDYTGESVTQSCTWIRPNSLFADLQDNNGWKFDENIRVQIVGHTPVTVIKPIEYLSEATSRKYTLLLCDNLPEGYAVIDPDLDPWMTYKKAEDRYDKMFKIV